MLGTHPDLAYAVMQMVQQSTNLTQEHLDKALHICQYLITTCGYSLMYNGMTGSGITACTDSDWGADPETCHFQMGFYLKLANGIFFWNSHLQKTTALSSTEAEYMALSNCVCQVIWIKQMFGKLQVGYPICGYNQGFIFMANNPITERRTKHIPICYHFVHDAVTDQHIEIFYIGGTDNPADMFTKNLGYIKFEQCRSQISLVFN